jgi:hypothetical protein
MPRYIRSSHVYPCHYSPPRSAGHTAAIVPTAICSPAAINTQTATQAQGQNPLWAINIGMGVFLAAAALVVVLN